MYTPSAHGDGDQTQDGDWYFIGDDILRQNILHSTHFTQYTNFKTLLFGKLSFYPTCQLEMKPKQRDGG